MLTLTILLANWHKGGRAARGGGGGGVVNRAPHDPVPKWKLAIWHMSTFGLAFYIPLQQSSVIQELQSLLKQYLPLFRIDTEDT